MIERAPPRLALWLLRRLGSSYHAESLVGDLIEQYQEGRSRAWYWGQVAAAILLARARFIRSLRWWVAGRALSHLLAETAAVLAIVTVVDHERHVRASAIPMNLTFVVVLFGLVAVVLVGFLASTRSGHRLQRHAAGKVLLLAFGVIALGVGTLTWADSLRGETRPIPACPAAQ
jgi:hypothetical protein